MRERGAMPAADVMERYVAAARRHDFDAAFAMFAEDIVFRIPGGEEIVEIWIFEAD
jgi:ketosteroid isomerase-like protein